MLSPLTDIESETLSPRIITKSEDGERYWIVPFRRDLIAPIIAKYLDPAIWSVVFDPLEPKDWRIQLGLRLDYKDDEAHTELAGTWVEMDHLCRNHLLEMTLCQNARPPPSECSAA
jgi:hypothetical protein